MKVLSKYNFAYSTDYICIENKTISMARIGDCKMSKISIPEVAKLVFIGFAVVDYKLFIQVSVI